MIRSLLTNINPGRVISNHIDCIPCFKEIIISVSLLSYCIIQFSKDEEKYDLLLSPRSILLLSGEARYKWKHGIKSVKNDKWLNAIIPRERRISITFRKINN